MIIKGNRHNNGPKLARYMMTGEHGERAELGELRGFASGNIVEAFRDVHLMADAHGIENPFFHVQVRLPEGEELKPEQWQRTADATQKRLGLTGQARAITFHINEMTGERHMHMAISLIDEETLQAKPVPFYKYRLKALARELEKEFDITRVKNHRDGPIKYAAKKNEQQQAQRLGTDKDAIRNTIRACWDQSDCGRSFEGALAHEGMILAQGDQRGLVVVDHAGGVHALGKRILPVNKSQMLERLADININELPSVEQAQSLIREMNAELQPEPQPKPEKQPNWDRDRANQTWEDAVIKAAIQHEKTARQFVEPKPEKEPRAGQQEKEQQPVAHVSYGDARIRDAQTAAMLDKRAREGDPVPNVEALAEALEQKGIAFAVVNSEESYRSHRENAFVRTVGRKSAYFEPGEIVLVTEPRLERLRAGEWTEPPRVHKLDQAKAEQCLTFLSIDKSKLKGIDATKEVLNASAQDRAAYWQSIRLERATDIWRGGRTLAGNAKDNLLKSPAAIIKAATLPLNAVGKVLQVLENLFEGLFAPKLTPEQLHRGELSRQEREDQAEHQIDFSKYTADRAQERQNHQEQQAARDRQRELERDR